MGSVAIPSKSNDRLHLALILGLNPTVTALVWPRCSQNEIDSLRDMGEVPW